MRRSTERFLTTHAGSLPYPEPGLASDGYGLEAAVTNVVEQQRQTGLDLINEGEYTKGGDWLSFVESRFGGFEERAAGPASAADRAGQDREEFADFYQYADRSAARCSMRRASRSAPGARYWVCTGPVSVHRPGTQLAREIDAAGQARRARAADVFLTSTAPASLEVYRRNELLRDRRGVPVRPRRRDAR